MNEIEAFNGEFSKLRRLWYNKLCTPLEEVQSMQDALVKMKSTTSALAESLRSKTDSFQKFQESAKEQMEQRKKELEDLNNLGIQRRTEK